MKKRKQPVQSVLNEVSQSIDKMQKAMEKKTEVRRNIEKQCMDLENEKVWWAKAEKMFGA